MEIINLLFMIWGLLKGWQRVELIRELMAWSCQVDSPEVVTEFLGWVMDAHPVEFSTALNPTIEGGEEKTQKNTEPEGKK